MTLLNQFIDHLETSVKNGCTYVWGAQGQLCTEEFIKEHESGSDETKALKLYRKRISQGYAPSNIRAYDCSGLGMYFMYDKTKTYKSDLTAHGMKGKCVAITRNDLRRGDWVFRVYKSGNKKGRAYHVGYVVDDDLNIIEVQGRAYGVVKRDINASGTGYWNAYGRPIVFQDEIESAEPAEWHVKRTLKPGLEGNDVRGLQLRLMAAGFDLPRYGADGDFGEETESAVIAYKKKNGLTYTGTKAGWVTKTMVTRLGGRWK